MKQIKLNNGCMASIRNASKSDAKEMLIYIDRISKESDNLTFGEGEFGITLDQEENFIESISMKNNALFIVAEMEGKIIGNLSFAGGVRPRTAHTGEFGVSVLKEYWGLGVGTELITYLIQWCKQTGIVRKVNLKVRSDNYSAIHVYKKLGFNEEGVITRDLLIGSEFYDSILMGLNIE